MRVRELRRMAGLTQEKLAARVGIARETVSRIETNRVTPDLNTLIKFSDALNCSLDELVGRNPSRRSEVIVPNLEG